MPRHSPCALFRLTFVGASSVSFALPFPAELIHSAAPPLPRECSFARMETGVTKLAPDIGSLNYAGSFRISSTKLCALYSSTIASEFPSVALLVFPLFSFQCADRRCKLRIVRSGASARAHFLRCISSSSRTFVRSDGDEGYDMYPLN